MADLIADGYYIYIETPTIAIPDDVVESGDTAAIFEYVKNRIGIVIKRRYVLTEEEK